MVSVIDYKTIRERWEYYAGIFKPPFEDVGQKGLESIIKIFIDEKQREEFLKVMKLMDPKTNKLINDGRQIMNLRYFADILERALDYVNLGYSPKSAIEFAFHDLFRNFCGITTMEVKYYMKRFLKQNFYKEV